MSRLDGKVAVITGGSSGIGLATAARFVEEGAHVFITGRRKSELDKAKALIGDGVTTVAADATNGTDLDRLFATVLEEKGALDILVANSGRVEPEELGKITEENFDLTFDLNARATLFTVQKALPLMRHGGSVILIGSIAGYVGIRGYSTYSATKAALRSYTRTWTREFADRGIRFNTLSPGPVDTPIMDGQADSPEEADAIRAQFAAAIPLNRMGRREQLRGRRRAGVDGGGQVTQVRVGRDHFLNTESGLTASMCRPCARVRKQVEDYEASGGVEGNAGGPAGGEPDVGGREIGQGPQEPVMRIVDGERYAAWHRMAGRPPTRPGTPIWSPTRRCDFRMAPCQGLSRPRGQRRGEARYWAIAEQFWPHFPEYRRRAAGRDIPIMVLEPSAP